MVVAIVGLVSLVGGEIVARVDDLIERQIPLLGSPTYESELRVHKDGIWQGRPYGHYKKWKLNSWGFRSPEIGLKKRPRCARVLIIGASEMFGLYESPGNDFAAALLSRLNSQGCYELINAAMAGLGLSSARLYWNVKLVAFKPDFVLIYPTPMMNIDDRLVPAGAAANDVARLKVPPGKESAPVRSRLLDRLREFVHTPAVIDDWRIRRALSAELRQHPRDWVQQAPPAAGLTSFTTQLNQLIADIYASGAQILLMTHAVKITPQSLSDHPHDALWMQADVPNVAPVAQLEFTARANERVRAVATDRGFRLIDLDRLLSGCLECFVDPAHFTDHGAQLAASAAASAIESAKPVTTWARRSSN